MNDPLICKLIAKVEGIDYFTSEDIISYQNDLGMCREYNPITDDALCFQLMIKHDVVYLDGEAYAGAMSGCTTSEGEYYCTGKASDDNPNRAICLAILDMKGYT